MMQGFGNGFGKNSNKQRKSRNEKGYPTIG
jgi:hypothetical protein